MFPHQQYDFETLPDYLRPGLNLIFIGINPGLYSVRRGHYFARTTSRFWPAFSKSKLSAQMRRELKLNQLLSEHDSLLPRFGIGLTDVVKRPSANASELTPTDFITWYQFSSRNCAATSRVSPVFMASPLIVRFMLSPSNLPPFGRYWARSRKVLASPGSSLSLTRVRQMLISN